MELTHNSLDVQTMKLGVTNLAPWFHNIELAPGVWTNPGSDYPDSRWRLLEPLVPDVRGLSCLDAGCSSGYFSLKLKQLGAGDVVGIDAGEQHRAIEQARFAASCLGLEVNFLPMSIYDVSRLDRKFDVCLFLGLYYHLHHPLFALEKLREVCRDTLLMQSITTRHHAPRVVDGVPRNVRLWSNDARKPGSPTLHFIEGELDGDGSCWYIPNPEAVFAMLRVSGFFVEKAVYPNSHEMIVRARAS